MGFGNSDKLRHGIGFDAARLAQVQYTGQKHSNQPFPGHLIKGTVLLRLKDRSIHRYIV